MSCKKTSIGGQALIEGIMMRGPKRNVMAVRMKDGSIETFEMNINSIKDKSFFFRLPIVRGVVNFVESMIVGYKAMMESADKSGYLDDLEEEDKEKEDKNNGKLMSVIMVIATVLAVILCIGLFIALPSYAFKGLNYLAMGVLEPFKAIFEGVLKIAIFLSYMAAVSMMKDIRRVFSFHGAEHKTIFCYEAGLPLTVENVREQKRFHPRCGTSFMILILIVSIFLTIILDAVMPPWFSIVWIRTIIKLLIIPFVCGLGYELIKVCGRYDNIFTRIVAAPGLWIQRITVKEPDDSMIEVAIAAMNEVIPQNSEEDNW